MDRTDWEMSNTCYKDKVVQRAREEVIWEHNIKTDFNLLKTKRRQLYLFKDPVRTAQ
jgi:hypothetical protein